MFKLWCTCPHGLWLKCKSVQPASVTRCSTNHRADLKTRLFIISDIRLVPQRESQGEDARLAAGSFKKAELCCRFKFGPCVTSSFWQHSTQGHESERRSTIHSIPLLQCLTNLSEGWTQVRSRATGWTELICLERGLLHGNGAAVFLPERLS